MHAKSFYSCLILCDPIDYRPPGSSVHGFFRQEYWRGLPCPLPGGLPNPEIEPASLTSPELAAAHCRSVHPVHSWCGHLEGRKEAGLDRVKGPDVV